MQRIKLGVVSLGALLAVGMVGIGSGTVWAAKPGITIRTGTNEAQGPALAVGTALKTEPYLPGELIKLAFLSPKVSGAKTTVECSGGFVGELVKNGRPTDEIRITGAYGELAGIGTCGGHTVSLSGFPWSLKIGGPKLVTLKGSAGITLDSCKYGVGKSKWSPQDLNNISYSLFGGGANLNPSTQPGCLELGFVETANVRFVTESGEHLIKT